MNTMAPLTITAAILAAQSPALAAVVALPGMWSVVYAPAAALGSIVRAAEAGVVHVCTSITVTLSAAVAAQANPISFILWDGASGATRLWNTHAAAGVNVARPTFLSGLSLVGTEGLAMTLEAAGGPLLANSTVSMTLTGYSLLA
jgi:hypothetical protein